VPVMNVLDPESVPDTEARGDSSSGDERAGGPQRFPNPKEMAVDEDANRPRTGEEFLVNVAREAS
jgi:hypothetical protein